MQLRLLMIIPLLGNLGGPGNAANPELAEATASSSSWPRAGAVSVPDSGVADLPQPGTAAEGPARAVDSSQPAEVRSPAFKEAEHRGVEPREPSVRPPGVQRAPPDPESLALLGKIWGFLKYHHPQITAGGVDWDEELLAVLPAVSSAAGWDEARPIVTAWLERMDPPGSCAPCAILPDDLLVRPPVDWIHDDELLGQGISHYLTTTYQNRHAGSEQYYVTKKLHVGNAQFDNERRFSDSPSPPTAVRILALFRFWNIVQYWYPYRELIDADWDDILVQSIPRFISASTEEEYRQAVGDLVAQIDDTHGVLFGPDADLTEPIGDHYLPVDFRFAEDRVVITGHLEPPRQSASPLEIGDVITHIDGSTVDEMVKTLAAKISASNRAGLHWRLERTLLRGPAGVASVSVDRAGRRMTFEVERKHHTALDLSRILTHDRAGPTFQLLAADLAYIKLSGSGWSDIPHFLEQATGKNLIMDLRGYPKEFVLFALGNHLVGGRTPFVRFTSGDFSNPGAYVLRPPPLWLEPEAPRFRGKVAVLVDEMTVSQGEYTAMALRAVPDVVIVGSQTAGADGDVSRIPLPGRLAAYMTGIGVYYPDGSQTQRTGIRPDIRVEPSIEGIRAGRDEVLEAAISALRR